MLGETRRISGFHDLKALLTLALAVKNGSPLMPIDAKAPSQGYAVPLLINQERVPPPLKSADEPTAAVEHPWKQTISVCSASCT